MMPYETNDVTFQRISWSYSTRSRNSYKYLKRKHQIDFGQQRTMNNKCYLCKSSVEYINHVISSCPKKSGKHYPPLHHDALVKYVLKAVIMKNHPDMKYRELAEYEYIIKHDDMECWLNISI